MTKFIENLTFTEGLILLGIVILVLFVVLGVILFIFHRIKKIKIKNKSGSFIEIGEDTPKEKLPDNNKIGIEKKYIYSTDILLLIEKITFITMQKAKIMFTDTTKKQMDFAEQRLLKIKGILQSNYLRTLSNKLESKNNLTGHEDYLFYSVILDISLRDTKDILRASFKENDIPNPKPKNNGDNKIIWGRYIRNKIDVILQKHTDFFNVMYLSHDKLVTREEIYEFTYKGETRSQITDIIIEIYREGEKIKNQLNNTIHDIDVELKNFLNNYLKLSTDNNLT